MVLWEESAEMNSALSRWESERWTADHRKD